MNNSNAYFQLEKIAEKMMDSIRKDKGVKENLYKQLDEDIKKMPVPVPVCRDNNRMAFEKWYSEKYGISPFGCVDGAYTYVVVQTSFEAYIAGITFATAREIML
jgi:hypothetical protein